MKAQKWYQSLGVWFYIQVAILFILGVLSNWIDKASIIGGFMLLCITLPYLVLWIIISTIKEIRLNKAADVEQISNKEK